MVGDTTSEYSQITKTLVELMLHRSAVLVLQTPFIPTITVSLFLLKIFLGMINMVIAVGTMRLIVGAQQGDMVLVGRTRMGI